MVAPPIEAAPSMTDNSVSANMTTNMTTSRHSCSRSFFIRGLADLLKKCSFFEKFRLEPNSWVLRRIRPSTLGKEDSIATQTR